MCVKLFGRNSNAMVIFWTKNVLEIECIHSTGYVSQWWPMANSETTNLRCIVPITKLEKNI